MREEAAAENEWPSWNGNERVRRVSDPKRTPHIHSAGSAELEAELFCFRDLLASFCASRCNGGLSESSFGREPLRECAFARTQRSAPSLIGWRMAKNQSARTPGVLRSESAWIEPFLQLRNTTLIWRTPSRARRAIASG